MTNNLDEEKSDRDSLDFKPILVLDDDGLYNDIDEEDIRRMAEALAPQMSELEDVLNDISATDDDMTSTLEIAESANRSMQEEDDDLDDELQQLAMSEQALREELEFAQDINLMLTPSKSDGSDNAEDPPASMDPDAGDAEHAMAEIRRMPSLDPVQEKPPAAYTLKDHAEFLKIRTENSGGWYYCDMSSFVQGASEAPSTDLMKDYCLPIPFRKLKRLYSGLTYHPVLSGSKQKVASTPSKGFLTPTKTTQRKPLSTPGEDLMTITPVRTPATTPAGPEPTGTPVTPSSTLAPPPPPPVPQEEPLPVRTLSIKIRPDVLVGAVMDAIHHAFETLPSSCTSHILKRQGGHLRGGVYLAEKALAYVADVQLCTQRNDDLGRRLVVRFYHVQDDPEAMHEMGQVLQRTVPPSPGLDGAPTSLYEGDDENKANRHMKQSCSLIQRLMAAQQQGGTDKMDAKQQSSWLGLRGTAFSTKADMQKSVGKHLESNFKTCPSVREENKKATPTIRRLTLPSLSPKDWTLLEVTWMLTSSIMEELDTRDCTFNTLSTLPFGQFPALPTLDVHFCSQLRRLSRESMITHLLKSAKELEDYAKGAEYNCAICIALLEPMLGRYGIPPLDPPGTGKTLQDYPLEFSPPQVAFPPWGNSVMEALNKVAAKTPTGDIDVVTAVHMVYDAFIKQDDEEQAARLGRKNAQIMERLAGLQTHQRSLVHNIRDAHVYSAKAGNEAAQFLKHAQKALNAGREGFPRVLQPEVPLLNFRVSIGASASGKCYVSAGQLLFVTSYIPLVGGVRSHLFDLEHIDFQVDESIAATLLNPFPNTMNIVSRASNEVLFGFRPAVSPTRLERFLKIIQGYAGEEKPSEFSGVVDNLDVVEEDGVVRLSDATSEDQLSI